MRAAFFYVDAFCGGRGYLAVYAHERADNDGPSEAIFW